MLVVTGVDFLSLKLACNFYTALILGLNYTLKSLRDSSQSVKIKHNTQKLVRTPPSFSKVGVGGGFSIHNSYHLIGMLSQRWVMRHHH